MPTYYFTCECGHQSEVSPSHAGTEFVCLCGRQSIIPSIRKLTRKDRASWNPDTGRIEGRTGVQITTACVNWRITNFCVPRVLINERFHLAKWGQNFFELEPGKYSIRLYYRFLFFKCGYCSLKLSIQRDQVPEVQYRASSFPFWEAQVLVKK